MVFNQTKQIPRLWYAKEGAYLFDKQNYFQVFYNDSYKKCLDIYEAINYLFVLTNEAVELGCDNE